VRTDAPHEPRDRRDGARVVARGRGDALAVPQRTLRVERRAFDLGAAEVHADAQGGNYDGLR
jgi:hypothetical protein